MNARGAALAASRPQQDLQAPSTPKSIKANAEIHKIFKRLHSIGVDIDLSEAPSSPSSRGQSSSARTANLVRTLFFQDPEALRTIVQNAQAQAESFTEQPSALREGLLDELRDACHLATQRSTRPSRKDRSKVGNVKNRLSVSAKHQKDVAWTARIDSYFPNQSKGHGSAELLHLVSKRLSETSNSKADFSSMRKSTSSSTLSTLADDVQLSTRNTTSNVSTVPTSFANDEHTPSSSPSSTYGSQLFDASQVKMMCSFAEKVPFDSSLDTIEDLTMNKTKSPRVRARTTNPMAPPRMPRAEARPRASLPPHEPRTPLPDQNAIFATQASTVAGSTPCRNYLLANLSNESLVTIDLNARLNTLPFGVKWAVFLAVGTNKSLLDDLNQIIGAASYPSDIEIAARTWLAEQFGAAKCSNIMQQSLSGRLRAQIPHQKASRSQGLLHLEATAPEDKALSRLEQKFDPQRFLTLTFADPDPNVTRHVSCRLNTFLAEIRKFLLKSQDILGCMLRCFQVRQLERDGDSGSNSYRLSFFVESGPGMTPITIRQVLDWAIPIDTNLNKPFHKTMARLDLSLSRTTRAFIFKPSQIRLCPDGSNVLADDTPEDTRFNDKRLKFGKSKSTIKAVMNDGCSQMSPAAARKICKGLNIVGHRPVAFQARLNGAKGMWAISGSYADECEDIWITISPSQLKVIPRLEDRDDDSCEPDKWSFEVVSYTTPPRTSNVHIDFLATLEDRGVPRDSIIEVISQQLRMDFSSLIDSCDDALALRKWLAEEYNEREARNRENGINYPCALPDEDFEKIVYLLEAGFEPTKHRYLAELINTQAGYWVQDMLERLKIRSSKTIMPYGIADLSRCLQPGEIFMAFSQPLLDEETGTILTHLEGDVLVSRHPSLRDSDMQRVTAVYRPELSHLRDVVVFPTKGSIPLASKLQGGDYDGDTFWICWDQRLVKPFRNSPVTGSSADNHAFGLSQEKESLGEILRRDRFQDPMVSIFDKAFKFAFRPQMLGKIRNYYTWLAYSMQNLRAKEVTIVADLHDRVIDASKTGLRCNETNWKNLLTALKLAHRRDTPAYEAALKHEATKPGGVDRPMKEDLHILDEIVFDFVLPQSREFRRQLEIKLNLRSAGDTPLAREVEDEDLVGPYHELRRLASTNPTALAAMEHLRRSVKEIDNVWSQSYNASMDKAATNQKYLETIREASDLLQRIEPVPSFGQEDSTMVTDPRVQSWLLRVAPSAPTLWEIFRASFLYHHRLSLSRSPSASFNGSGASSATSKSRTRMAFVLAGRELCYLKSYSIQGAHPRIVKKDVWGIYKVRKQRQKRLVRGRCVSAREQDDDDE